MFQNEFTMHCEALQTTLRNGASRLSSRLNEIEEVLKENAFSLVPKIGTDWNEVCTSNVRFPLLTGMLLFLGVVRAIRLSKHGR